MSHYPASGIAPHQLPVGRPRKVLLMCCCTSNLRGRRGGQPACRSHSASWSMSPSHTAHNSKHWLPDQPRGLKFSFRIRVEPSDLMQGTILTTVRM